MATFADFCLPPTAFPLGVVFEAFPDATVELERVVPTKSTVRPYFWVTDADDAGVLEFLADQPTIAHPKLVDRLDGRALFRYHSPMAEAEVLSALVESDVTLLSAVGTQSGWEMELRGDEQSALAAFDERCRSLGIEPTLRDIQSTAARRPDRTEPVTDAQREALLLAYDRGYYAEPRETTLEELAASVGISRQAFARRLTRGYRTLVESQLRPGS